MKIVFIRSQPIIRGPSYDRIPATLARTGYDVVYLGWDRENKYAAFENNGLYRIYRYRNYISSRLKKYTGFLQFWYWVYVYLIHQKPYIVHVCDSNVLPPALLYKCLYGRPLVYQLYDFSADEQFYRFPVARAIFGFIEKCFISLSDAVICVSEAQLQYQLTHMRLKQYLVLLNTPPDRYKKYHSLNRTNIQEKRMQIFYGGNVRDSRGLDILCDIVKKKDLDLIIAGDGPFLNALQCAFSASKNIHFLGEMSHENILEFAGRADVIYACYAPIQNNLNMKIGGPNKFYESLMLGKPIITNCETSISTVVMQGDTGFTVPYGDRKALGNLLDFIIKNPEILKSKGEKARALYKQRYDWQLFEPKICQLYRQFIPSGIRIKDPCDLK